MKLYFLAGCAFVILYALSMYRWPLSREQKDEDALMLEEAGLDVKNAAVIGLGLVLAIALWPLIFIVVVLERLFTERP